MRPSSADTSVPASERYAQAVARRLVHLAEYHRHLGLGQVVDLHHARFHHLVIEVVAFARALADAGEHRKARVLGGDVVDQLQHVHRLAHPGAAEQADLAALGERADEVDHLDAGLEQLDRWRQLVELGRDLVDRALLVRLDRADVVDRTAEHVHDAAERARADRHRNRPAGRGHLHAAAQAVGRAERDAAHHAVAELLLNLEGELLLDQRIVGVLDQEERVVDARHAVTVELDVRDRADALDDGALTFRTLFLCHG
jgi:peptide chain release factor 1